MSPPPSQSVAPPDTEQGLAVINMSQTQNAQAPTEGSILRRLEYDVSSEFSRLIKPHFFARDSAGTLVPALGEPELVLELQGGIKIRLDNGSAARYSDLLALESEQIGEHPVHKIFRMEAMGVPVAWSLYMKLQPGQFDPTPFRRLDFEYQSGQQASGVI